MNTEGNRRIRSYSLFKAISMMQQGEQREMKAPGKATEAAKEAYKGGYKK